MGAVAPRVGAWIETTCFRLYKNSVLSHPVWVRGLKQQSKSSKAATDIVAPRVGAWIETLNGKTNKQILIVAPRVGAWIETIC